MNLNFATIALTINSINLNFIKNFFMNPFLITYKLKKIIIKVPISKAIILHIFNNFSTNSY